MGADEGGASTAARGTHGRSIFLSRVLDLNDCSLTLTLLLRTFQDGPHVSHCICVKPCGSTREIDEKFVH
jgi:hypothetical protein